MMKEMKDKQCIKLVFITKNFMSSLEHIRNDNLFFAYVSIRTVFFSNDVASEPHAVSGGDTVAHTSCVQCAG
jgi:hypothetical protein